MLEIRVEEEGRVFFAGRFDASEVENARRALKPVRGTVELDLSELEYVSSAGIGVFVALHKRLSDAGATMKVSKVSPRIRNIFRLAGLDRIIAMD